VQSFFYAPSFSYTSRAILMHVEASSDARHDPSSLVEFTRTLRHQIALLDKSLPHPHLPFP
jgi:hypothetical protein